MAASAIQSYGYRDHLFGSLRYVQAFHKVMIHILKEVGTLNDSHTNIAQNLLSQQLEESSSQTPEVLFLQQMAARIGDQNVITALMKLELAVVFGGLMFKLGKDQAMQACRLYSMQERVMGGLKVSSLSRLATIIAANWKIAVVLILSSRDNARDVLTELTAQLFEECKRGPDELRAHMSQVHDALSIAPACDELIVKNLSNVEDKDETISVSIVCMKDQSKQHIAGGTLGVSPQVLSFCVLHMGDVVYHVISSTQFAIGKVIFVALGVYLKDGLWEQKDGGCLCVVFTGEDEPLLTLHQRVQGYKLDAGTFVEDTDAGLHVDTATHVLKLQCPHEGGGSPCCRQRHASFVRRKQSSIQKTQKVAR